MAKIDLEKILNQKLNEILDKIPTYVLEFGVFAGSEKNKRNPIKGKKKTNIDTSKGLTNGEIMFIMEEGSLINHIPPRPVLRLSREYAIENLVPSVEEKLIQIWLTYGKEGEPMMRKEVDKLALKIEAYVKTGIRRRQFDIAPNALSTIEKKGSDIPLLDTGQLANSIQCRVKRIK